VYLKSLELSGFKSFARNTVLEFPHPVTAIVGPNGSGKSNIKEAIQWVLGEQSLKSLRGKKGEDLIWNGSPGVGRMGKASVVLAFDNALGRIPLDFEEVRVGRRIFRDGTGEYMLNDSVVRLKDVAELAAGMGLGEAKHNIIGQGEVDRILLASPRDRKAMIEEALGLRVHHLKREDAARRMSATEENILRVKGLLAEIAPYLKFLRQQAKKAEMRKDLEEELARLRRLYYLSAMRSLEKDTAAFEVKYAPYRDRRTAIEKEVAVERAELARLEKAITADRVEDPYADERKRCEARRHALERDLGRLEARLELEREKLSAPLTIPVDAAYMADELGAIAQDAGRVAEDPTDADHLRQKLRELVVRLNRAIADIRKGAVEKSRGPEDMVVLAELDHSLAAAQIEYRAVTGRLEEIADSEREARTRRDELREKIRIAEARLRDRQGSLRDIDYRLAPRDAERAAIAARRVRLDALKRELGPDMAGVSAENTGFGMSSEELEKKIERMRAKLEDIGGIDPQTLKEHRETEERHAFLAKELEDLTAAHDSLKEIMRELERRIR